MTTADAAHRPGRANVPPEAGGRVLVVNCGSSSVKYRLLAMDGERRLAGGVIEVAAGDLGQAFRHIGVSLQEFGAADAVGHRVVHGGERFREPTLVDASVCRAIRELEPLAPLHNPANLAGIELCLAAFPGVPQVAVFDTAFHHTLPPRAYRYAVPEAWYRLGVRRYGFHGTSHRYVAERAAAALARPLAELNLITLHLGNGASVAAIERGRCVDTSMGFTPLEGLVMGTRSGDLDPAVPFFVARTEGLAADAVEEALNEESGLRGLCGTNDVREILAREVQGDERARLALEIYGYRIRKYVGAYTAALGRVDALIFTGGVGENAARVRALACAGLERLGVALDPERNASAHGDAWEIGSGAAPVRVLVVRTDEELQIARETLATVRAARARP